MAAPSVSPGLDLVAAAAARPPDVHYPETRVLIIMTGGTICMRQTAADGMQPVGGFMANALAPRPSFNDGSPQVRVQARFRDSDLLLQTLRTPSTSYGRHVRYGVLEFSPLLDSSSVSSDGWAEIAAAVRDNYRLFDGFVVLHGTDSLAYTASALSFMMEDLGKPVVLTGSQASIFALQSDAVGNLLGALVLAGTFVIPEVAVFFHNRLLRGNRTVKVSAAAFDAFASPNCDPLATMSGLGIAINWALVRRPTAIAWFRIAPPLHTADVACLRIFPGIRPEMVDAVLRLPGLRGLVLETFGMGNAPGGVDGSLTAAVRAAVQRGVVVVNVSQCISGFVSPVYGPATDLGRAGVIFGLDLTPEAALTKLAYLLAVPTLTARDIGAQMSRSLRGEMTEPAAPSFSHPPPVVAAAVSSDFAAAAAAGSPAAARLAAPETAFAALAYAIRAQDVCAVREMLDADADALATPAPYHLLTLADYAGNTALHLAALNPAADVLRELLLRGASVHVRNRANCTSLFLADRAGSLDCVRLLRDAGAHLWQDLPPADGSVALSLPDPPLHNRQIVDVD